MGKLVDIVRKNAEGKVNGRLNLRQYSKRKAAHVEVCKALVDAMDRYKLPITLLVYLGVGKQAHRLSVIEKGYKSYDVDKVEKIVRWLKMFAHHSKNQRLYRDSVVVHALCSYYDKVSKKTRDFKAALEASQEVDKNRYYKVEGILALLGVNLKEKKEDASQVVEEAAAASE